MLPLGDAPPQPLPLVGGAIPAWKLIFLKTILLSILIKILNFVLKSYLPLPTRGRGWGGAFRKIRKIHY
jgi:hypothetical protein